MTTFPWSRIVLVATLVAQLSLGATAVARQYSEDEAAGLNGHPPLGWATYYGIPSYPGKPDVKSRDLLYRTPDEGRGWSGTPAYLYTDNEDELYSILFSRYPITHAPDVLGSVSTYSEPRNLVKQPWVKQMGAVARRQFSYQVTHTIVDRHGGVQAYIEDWSASVDQYWYCKRCWGFKENSDYDFVANGPFTCSYTAISWCPDDLGACYANPVDVGVGAKLQWERDFALGSGLEWTRRFSSWSGQDEHLDATAGKFWRHTYQRYLRFQGAPAAPSTIFHYGEKPPARPYAFVDGNWTAGANIQDQLRPVVDQAGTTIGWSLRRADTDATEQYDLAGRLSRIDGRDGKSTLLSYDSRGRLSEVSDAFGRTIAIAYDGRDRVATARDAAGFTWRYEYAANDALTSVAGPGETLRQYVYNEAGNTSGAHLPYALTGIVDENGSRFATFGYDPSGRVVYEDHAGIADQVRFTYSSGSAAAIKDAAGNTRNVALALVAGTLVPANVSAPGPDCGANSGRSRTFDASGNVVSQTDFNDRKACSAYDGGRNLETTRVEGLLAGERCDAALSALPDRPDVRKVSTQWHPVWRVPTKVAGPNRITTWVYNGDGGARCAPPTALVTGTPIGVPCSKTVQETMDATGQHAFAAVPTGAPRTWTYSFDRFGQLLTATDPQGRLTIRTYYAADDPDLGKRGNVATITNPAGHVTRITAYDANGRATSVADPNGLMTNLAYDAHGRLTQRHVGPDGGPFEVTRYDFDGVGQLRRATHPDGSYIDYTYDAAHRLTQLQDGEGNRLVFTLDAMGNRIKEDAFDPDDRLARRRQQVFDSLNRLHQLIGAQQDGP